MILTQEIFWTPSEAGMKTLQERRVWQVATDFLIIIINLTEMPTLISADDTTSGY